MIRLGALAVGLLFVALGRTEWELPFAMAATVLREWAAGRPVAERGRHLSGRAICLALSIHRACTNPYCNSGFRTAHQRSGGRWTRGLTR